MNSPLHLMFQEAFRAFQMGDLIKAERILKQLLRIIPSNFDVLHLLAIVCAGQSKHLEALGHYKKALKLKPNDSLALSNWGSSLNALGQNQEALVVFQKALKINPHSPECWYNAGNVLVSMNRHEEALPYYEQSVKLNPGYLQAYINHGKVLFDLRRYAESLNSYDKALTLKPDYAEVYSNKGNALRGLKRYDEAMAHYDKALTLKPDHAEAYSNKGNALSDLKRYDEAMAHYDKALTLKPDYAEAYSNKGNVLNDLKRYGEAMAYYDKALTLKPDYAEAYSNKGNALNGLKRYGEAMAYYDKALNLKPDIDWVLGYCQHLKMNICNWSGLEKSLDLISKKLIEGKKVISPFPLLSLTDDVLLHKKSSEIYVQSRYPSNSVLGPIFRHSNNRKIRVGYFSADFRNHPVSLLTAELFELHDKDRFEIIAFSFGVDDRSEIRSRLNKAFHQFIDVSAMSDMEIVKLARDLYIDIAVDLTGHTSCAKTGIFSYRAAPIQISYIGYLGTMGAEYYDYLLADKTIISNNSQKFYSEKIVYLPSYQVNDRKRVISERQFTRAELGLPDTGFIFCCFNNNYKILPTTFDGWMRILNAVEGSVLFLYANNEWLKANLIKEAGLRGVDSARLVFGGRITSEEYLARYRVCDLFLDTFPYNAGTTASDALWSGLPVLTLMGQSFASRVAASLLNAIGLPELITSSQEEYEALAIELAKNPKKLANIKLKLANNRLNTPLFDTPHFTKNMEAAYVKMMERYQMDLQPDHISIA